MPVVCLPPRHVLATLSTRSGVRAVVFDSLTEEVPYSRPADVNVFVRDGQIRVNGTVCGTMAEALAIDPSFDPLNWTWTIPKPPRKRA